ncbi:hypothetical protein Agabi119p4_4364 [Agaricus bisporus var. burnettii]|uniref:Uncharacterized protein n=1 Tax=Agaricus bisporus var. burnettii TaxID=192524 RepID=A0A8H7F362_AGABI|nr:hypothetical protein Agabi119p4_4364 [Agaricus bisporus var. burnettii]
MDPTDKFRRALAPAFFAAAPPLAALHAARARLLPPHPPQDSAACSRCGSFLIHRSTLRFRKSRFHRRSCPVCGSASLSPLPTAPFPQTRHQSSAPSKPQQIPTTPPVPQPPKSRPKNKSGLQHLLARNRQNQQKEHHEKNNGHDTSGLAAFLSGL